MKARIKKETKLPMLVAMVCIVVLIASVFLPYFALNSDFQELADAMGGVPTSLYDFALSLNEQGTPALLLLLGIYGVSLLLAALLALLRKPIGVMVFDLPPMGVATLTHMIFANDGTMDSGMYTWGIADKLIFAVGAMLYGFEVFQRGSPCQTAYPAFVPVGNF